MPRSNKKLGDFELWIGSGHLNAKCKDCGTSPTLEYMGFDPVFPKFKLVCNKCRTYDVMKIYLHLHEALSNSLQGQETFCEPVRWNTYRLQGKLIAEG